MGALTRNLGIAIRFRAAPLGGSGSRGDVDATTGGVAADLDGVVAAELVGLLLAVGCGAGLPVQADKPSDEHAMSATQATPMAAGERRRPRFVANRPKRVMA